MDDNVMLLAASSIDAAIVVAILLAAAIFLAVLMVRFFRGQVTCACDKRRKGCSTTRTTLSLDQLTKSPVNKSGE